jgi:hypothetical protein
MRGATDMSAAAMKIGFSGRCVRRLSPIFQAINKFMRFSGKMG